MILTNNEKPKSSKALIVVAIIVAAFVAFILIWGVYRSSVIIRALGRSERISTTPTISPKATKSQVKTAKKSVVSSDENESTDSADPAQTGENQNNTTDNSLNDQINFFVDITTKDTKGHVAGVTRWVKPTINIRIFEGQPTATQQSCLSSLISDFNSQSSTAKMAMSNSEADIRMFFLPDDEVQQLHIDGEDVDGFHESTTADDGCSRLESRVIISNDPGNVEAFQCYLVRHELSHAMGFWGHSDVFSQSIMSYARPGYDFPEVDKKAIRMLYNSGLPTCSREAQVREFFAAHPPS